VTDIPGTTRDAIEAVADVGSWPVRLVDTAGLRETRDVVERLGIEVSERYLGSADAVLACGETAESLALTASRVRALTPAPVILVRTKSDLVTNSYQDRRASTSASGAHGKDTPEELRANRDYYTPGPGVMPGVSPSDELVSDSYYCAPVSSGDSRFEGERPADPAVAVSAATGAGLGALADALARLLADRYGAVRGDVRGDRSAPLLTRERHRVAVERARGEVADFARAWREGSLPATVAAVHLHAAATALESLIGGVDVEDVLDRIFSDFCVGK
jgi:tRNA modification GTPase